jgi:hypothetical protein
LPLVAPAGLRPVAAADLLRVIFDLHELRRHLPTARLSFEPWPGRSPFSVAGAKHIAGENRTPRIPEEIITPLLAWSLRYVTHFSGDILAARGELDRLEAGATGCLPLRPDSIPSSGERGNAGASTHT